MTGIIITTTIIDMMKDAFIARIYVRLMKKQRTIFCLVRPGAFGLLPRAIYMIVDFLSSIFPLWMSPGILPLT